MHLRNKKNTPTLPALLGFSAFLALSGNAFADAAADCKKQIDMKTADLNKYKQKMDDAHSRADSIDEQLAKNHVDRLVREIGSKQAECDKRASDDQEKKEKDATAASECQKKIDETTKDGNSMWFWSKTKKKCISNVGSKDLPDNDECGSASVFSGSLKGQNCKKAKTTIAETQARSSAITDATTAFTTAYAGQQVLGVNSQVTAQEAQANAMKFAAYAKLASAANSLSSAMQLKSAAAGAAEANSTITEAHKGLASACPTPDDQTCFFQNASKFGITADQTGYATFERMKTGARQSQEQADAANLAAKGSMITGLADTLVGLQAMKMAQQAGQNVQAMAPPPLMPGAPPPGIISLGGGGPMPAPSLAPAPPQGPVDYGNPSGDGTTFGEQKYGRMGSGLVKGNMGAPNGFRPAASGVSGGGGGGGGVSGAGGSGRGNSGKGRSGNRPQNVGEYNLAAGGPGFKGGAGAEKGDGSNPFAEALAKLFPQNQNGTPVVDTRQIASGEQAVMAEATQFEGQVTAADLTIFEQITAKYRQLEGTGRY